MLSEEDRAVYDWQLDVPGLGEAGQEKLRKTTALVSRIGGLGGPVALALAAAGILAASPISFSPSVPCTMQYATTCTAVTA